MTRFVIGLLVAFAACGGNVLVDSASATSTSSGAGGKGGATATGGAAGTTAHGGATSQGGAPGQGGAIGQGGTPAMTGAGGASDACPPSYPEGSPTGSCVVQGAQCTYTGVYDNCNCCPCQGCTVTLTCEAGEWTETSCSQNSFDAGGTGGAGGA